jgi:hypothetical protein
MRFDTDESTFGSLSHITNRDLHPKTLRSIVRQAGLSVDEFLDLL